MAAWHSGHVPMYPVWKQALQQPWLQEGNTTGTTSTASYGARQTQQVAMVNDSRSNGKCEEAQLECNLFVLSRLAEQLSTADGLVAAFPST